MKRIALAAITSALVFTVPARAETWTAYTFGPSETLANVQGLRRVLDGVQTATNGDIKFRLRLAGALPIQSTDITQAVGDGTVLFADDGLFLGNVPIAGILRLPMLLRSREDYDRAAAIMEPYIRKGFESKGVIVLGYFLFPHQVPFSTKPLATASEFKGQKLRVSSPEQARFVQIMGGVPVTMGAPEVPSGLQHGAIDGVFTASAGGGKIWGEMLKSNYRLPVSYFDGVYLVNKAAFEKLSPEVQAKIRQAVKNIAPSTTEQLFKEESEVTANLKSKGMTITEPTQAEIDEVTKLVSPYWNEWATQQGTEATEALAKVRSALGR
ncbi:TRAP transporter substrate-binding protein DctP [Microvirga pudoricolor]|uniref:TRAP transporter substrate-binding protein DctP n=1 Tax=Microvirga pudoricolor TaxID=2778729 RepID=UPI00194F9665|nr:TRAP transporter substrate-binding protein DctP [Microvirga pudoricolor]MBM6595321.1 TRAP transporter substrate-binding protein DctP [Microvirga pudoricolor]